MKKIEFYLESCLENPPKQGKENYTVYEVTDENIVNSIGDIYYNSDKNWYFLGCKIPNEKIKNLYYMVGRVVDA
mgnify:CR=1 FL=1